ncbi:MAG TPA: hypothetical protein VFW66_04175 [Gemmatimonadales bacterium]|nr:hypothetical protein [Gemmatimonadales bacterium]
MLQISLQELRRVADSLATLRGQMVVGAVMRSDRRQLRVELGDGRMAVVSIDADADGRPRLEFDVVRRPAEQPQLEVRFESA